MALRLLAAVLILVCSCGAAGGGGFWPEFVGEWTYEERSEVLYGATRWNAACGVEYFHPGGQPVPADWRPKPSWEDPHVIARGGASAIWFYPEARDGFFRYTAMHELGHVIGLQHTDGGVMNSTVVKEYPKREDCPK